MAKPPKQPVGFSGLAVAIIGNKDSAMLTEALEIEIADGVVVNTTKITRTENLPAYTIGVIGKHLWTHLRGLRGKD